MTQITDAHIREFLVERYATELTTAGLLLDSVPDNYDLLQEGVIDSLGVLEMISAVESAFGIKIDFENLDQDSLTKVGPFARYVAAQTNGQSAG